MSLVHWLISAIAIMAAAYLIPGVDVSFIGAFVLAIVLGLINLFVKPVLSLLTLPLNILTLGLFSLVLNALLVLLATLIVPTFVVHSFLDAVIFSVIISLINGLFNLGLKS